MITILKNTIIDNKIQNLKIKNIKLENNKIQNIKIINSIFKKIIVLIMLLFILFSSIVSTFAAGLVDMGDVSVPLTSERAGNYVANFAINFENNFSKKSEYSMVATDIGDTYNGNPVNNKYCFNSTSWIAFVYNQCLGLQSNTNFNSMTPYSYVNPHTQSTQASWNEQFFEQIKFNGNLYLVGQSEQEQSESENANNKTEFLNISSLSTNDELKPGDILIKSKNKQASEGEPQEEYIGEVYLYIGAGQVIYCKQPKTEEDKIVLIKCYLDDLDSTIDTVLRVKSETAAKILDTDATLVFANKGYATDIQYQGIPGAGTYLGTTDGWETGRWILDSLGNILDYLVGIITYAVRAVLIGWTNLVENLVHDSLLGLSEDVNGSYVNSLTGKANNLDSRVSIEEILFNKIPILDVNFFGVEQAGGSEIAEDSIVYMLRTNIAQWYSIIRTISIVSLLLLLIYMGIRIALTTIGDKKAQYKSALVGWLVAFLSVLAIHLFMYVIFEINEYFVTIFEKTALQMNGGEFSLYETIRTKSYAPKFTEGFGSTIIYMFLVFMLIRFSVMYFKRYLTVTILGLLGPVIGLKYAFERATGRKTKTIANWMFEFAMNVLLQSVHALLYVCLMQIAISMAFDSLAGFVIALIILNFMLNSDKIFMQIFSFDRAKSVGDTVQSESLLQQFAKITFGAKLTAKALSGAGKGVYKAGAEVIKFSEKAGDIWYEREEGETKKQNQRFIYKNAGKVGRLLNFITRDKISTIAALSLLQGEKSSKKMDKAVIAALQLNMKLNQKTYKRVLKAASTSIGGAAKIALSIPTTIVDPMAGISTAVGAVSAIKQGTDRTAINNMELQKQYERFVDSGNDNQIESALKYARRNKIKNTATKLATGPAVIAGTLASFGAGGVGKTAGFDIDKYEESRLKNHRLIETLKKADKTEKEINEIYKEIEHEIHKVNSGITAHKLKDKVNKEFGSTAKEAMIKRVKSSTVKGAIDEYMSGNSLTHLSELDVDNIMNIIKRRESEAGKKLEFDSDVLDNIRTALEEKMEANKSRSRKNVIISSDMQSAFKKGLAQKGSIKSTKVDSTKNDKVEELKEKLQERIREYENLYEGSGKKVEKADKIIKKITGEEKNK